MCAAIAWCPETGDVALTPTEFRILGCLVAAGERVTRRRELVAAARPTGAIVSDNTLDQYVARIRRKLSSVDPVSRLVTVHGVGYQLFTEAPE